MMAAAKGRAAEGGQRWTPMRADVYEALLGQDRPVTAYQIVERLSRKTGRDVKPASVYRSLDALGTLGLAVRIESLNAFTVCRHPNETHQHVFLVCRECGTADELADHDVAKRLRVTAGGQGFRVDRQILELQGACRSCQT